MKIIKKCSQILVAMAMWSTSTYANVYDEYLEYVDQKLITKITIDEKNRLISHPISRDTLRDYHRKELSKPDFDQICKKSISRNEEGWNALSIAILLGRVDKVEKWLENIDDVNNLDVNTWGYRQSYSLAHVALNPTLLESEDYGPLEKRLKIIDLLADKGADFNYRGPETGIYANPPLASCDVSGRYLDKNGDRHLEMRDGLQARAFLYGADPGLKGTSFFGVGLHMQDGSNDPAPVTKLTFKYFKERYMDGDNPVPRPCKEVLKEITKMAARKILVLQAMVDSAQQKAELDHENIIKQ